MLEKGDRMLQGLKEKIKVFFKYRNLLVNLVSRDIKVRYRRSILGMFWTVLNPLLMMVVITIVFSTLFKQNIEHFPIYYLSGSLIFSFSSETTSNALYSVIGNASLMKKVYIPKYLFPISKVVSGLVNLVFSLIAMFLVMLLLGVEYKVTLLLLPIPIFYTFLFATGLGLLLAAATVFFRDISHFYGVLVMAWTYFTPIFYPVDILPLIARKVMNWNPMFHYVQYMRELILFGNFPSIKENLLCFLFGIVMLFIGTWVFYKNQDRFVLYI